VRSEDSQNFSGHPYIGRIARSSLRLLCCLVTCRSYSQVLNRPVITAGASSATLTNPEP